jgi:hypothetical protein
VNANGNDLTGLGLVSFSAAGQFVGPVGFGAAGVSGVPISVTAANSAGAEAQTAILLDRQYGDVGDSMDIIWGAGSGIGGNRAGRLSAYAWGGGECAFVMYAQTGGGDGYANKVAEFRGNHQIIFPSLPTSSAGLPSGAIWRDAADGNTVKCIP